MKNATATTTHTFLGLAYCPGTARLTSKIETGPKQIQGREVEVTVTREQALSLVKRCTGTTKADIEAAILDLQKFMAEQFKH